MEKSEKSLNYQRIAKAINFIVDNEAKQPSLDKIAAHVNLNSFHFQRLFQEWADTTPEKFLHYISLSHAKQILSKNSISTMTPVQGLNITSRFHERYLHIEAMTPSEYKNEGESLTIHYSIQESPFGRIVMGTTAKGICQISFLESENEPLEILRSRFPKANYIEQEKNTPLDIFNLFSSHKKPIHVHLKGSDFQLKVWEALLKIPFGNLQTYGTIAQRIDQPSASRAVGTAIGANPLAYIIPCHRVIQSSGIIGGYMWGTIRKTSIIGWEAAKSSLINL